LEGEVWLGMLGCGGEDGVGHDCSGLGWFRGIERVEKAERGEWRERKRG